MNTQRLDSRLFRDINDHSALLPKFRIRSAIGKKTINSAYTSRRGRCLKLQIRSGHYTAIRSHCYAHRFYPGFLPHIYYLNSPFPKARIECTGDTVVFGDSHIATHFVMAHNSPHQEMIPLSDRCYRLAGMFSFNPNRCYHDTTITKTAIQCAVIEILHYCEIITGMSRN